MPSRLHASEPHVAIDNIPKHMWKAFADLYGLLLSGALECLKEGSRFYRERRTVVLVFYAGYVQFRWRVFQNLAVLETIIHLHKKILSLRSHRHPQRWQALYMLSLNLYERAYLTKDVASLEDAITYMRQSLELQLPKHSAYISMLHTLSHYLHTQWQLTHDGVALQESIGLLQKALDLCPAENPDHISVQFTLSSFFHDQWATTGDTAILKKANSIDEDLLKLLPLGHPRQAGVLQRLGTSSERQWEATGDTASLERLIRLRKEARELHMPNLMDRVPSFGANYVPDSIHLPDGASFRERATHLAGQVRTTN